MVKYIEKGDIFALPGVSSYAHGCNCAGAMGRGIAVQFRDMFPEMYIRYKALCQSGEYRPGDVFDYDYGRGHIYNLGTQLTWRTRATTEYIRESLVRMCGLARTDGVTRIAMPAIGAGLGGLQWPDVKAVIDEVGARFHDIDLYVVESYAPAPEAV